MHVVPLSVAWRFGRGDAERGVPPFAEPAGDVEIEELLAPEHSGQRLAHHALGIGREVLRDNPVVIGVGLFASLFEHRREVAAESAILRRIGLGESFRGDGRQAQLQALSDELALIEQGKRPVTALMQRLQDEAIAPFALPTQLF